MPEETERPEPDPEKTKPDKWDDPGDDDVAIRSKSPEALLDKYLRRD